MLEVKRFTDWDEAARHRDAWNALVLNSTGGCEAGVPSIYQTYEWNSSWWKAFGDGHEPLLLAVFEDGRLVGIAPLMITKKGLPVPSKLVRVMGGMNFSSDYCAFAIEANRPDVLRAIGDWLDAHPGVWNELEIMNILEGSAELEFLKQRYGARAELLYLCDAPTRRLGDPAEDKDLVSRDSLKRHTNWFKKQGELKCAHIDSADEIRARLDAFFEQHIQRRSVTADASQFTDEKEREFYRILVTTLAPLGWLRFFAVELNGAPLAFHFGFEFGQKFYWYKPTFDIKHIKKSPGEVLLKALFEYSIAQGLKEFDFTAGSEGFKYRFANHIRKLYRFRAFRSWPHYALHRAENESRRLARKILRRPTAATKPETVTAQ